MIPSGTDTIIGDSSGVHFFSRGARVKSIKDATANPLVGQAIAQVTGEWPHNDDTVAMAIFSEQRGAWLVGSR